MEIRHALDILGSIGKNVYQVIDVRNHPKAYGSMGLAPTEVEISTADAARHALDKYLERYPEQEREQIRRDLWQNYHDIQSVRNARVDLSFLDEEFGEIR